ncbi:hypothetical protein RvY_14306 [Ramazzottius varieornatus]|uniref:Uncharacterized protein n=1 Tax=Ramazzottius varieornatus TaxID=947166 RepID=A0A1D1VVX8_RAMVA|nr:hypothetical protein RvY_14306 [Ramazzottius varieornatus]
MLERAHLSRDDPEHVQEQSKLPLSRRLEPDIQNVVRTSRRWFARFYPTAPANTKRSISSQRFTCSLNS